MVECFANELNKRALARARTLDLQILTNKLPRLLQDMYKNRPFIVHRNFSGSRVPSIFFTCIYV